MCVCPCPSCRERLVTAKVCGTVPSPTTWSCWCQTPKFEPLLGLDHLAVVRSTIDRSAVVGSKAKKAATREREKERNETKTLGFLSRIFADSLVLVLPKRTKSPSPCPIIDSIPNKYETNQTITTKWATPSQNLKSPRMERHNHNHHKTRLWPF